jgi:hypothetical protein
MPPEVNTRVIVELPWLFVCGLRHESDWPTLPGAAAFTRAALSKTIWLSEEERPGPKYGPNGMTWARAPAGRRQATRAADNQDGDRDCINVSLSPRRHRAALVRLHPKFALTASLRTTVDRSPLKSINKPHRGR